MAMSEDELLQRALELSAQEHRATHGELILHRNFECPRSDLDAPCTQHWPVGSTPQQGKLLQVSALNQFAQHWEPFIKEFSTPSATCGYMAPTAALLMQQLLPTTPGSWRRQTISELLGGLRHLETFEPQLREAMIFIAGSRRHWIEQHRCDFERGADRHEYLSAWVANYEISDFLRAGPMAAELTSKEARPPLYFLRCNQWPERHKATHEELERLVEEKHFGGGIDSSGKPTYEKEDAVFIVESFSPTRQLQRPEDFVNLWKCESRPPQAPAIFVVDLNGHFVACVAFCLEEEDGTSGPALLVVNSTDFNYLSSASLAFLFDLAFPPSRASETVGVHHPEHPHLLLTHPSPTAMCDVCGSVGTASRCSIGCDWDICSACLALTNGTAACVAASEVDEEAVIQLLSMGFDEAAVRKALASTSGNAERALEALLC